MNSAASALEKLMGESIRVKIDLDDNSVIRCSCGHTTEHHEKPEKDSESPSFGKCNVEGCACSSFVKCEVGEDAWMAPLGPIEKVHGQSVANEAWKAVESAGGDEEMCAEASVRCEAYCILYYTLRSGPDAKAPRLFPNLRAVQTIPLLEVFRLSRLQSDTFCPTKDEIKNSLRARINASKI